MPWNPDDADRHTHKATTAIAAAAVKLRAKWLNLHGEAVVTGVDGVAVFDGSTASARPKMRYFNDLLELNSEDLRLLPPVDRKARLARKRLDIVFNEGPDEEGATVLRHACKLGLEGIDTKRLAARYRSGPSSRDWIKV